MTYGVKTQAVSAVDGVPALVRWDDIFQYDPTTGHFYWKSGRHEGNKTGYINGRGYICLRFKKRRFYAHRVAWEMSVGPLRGLQIDHINGNRADNRLVNLRPATPVQNNANTRKYKGLLPKGVYPKGRKFSAALGLNGKKQYIGTFPTSEEAHEAYCKTMIDIHGSYARSS